MILRIRRNGMEVDKIPEWTVRRLYAAGNLRPTDYYWDEGTAEWRGLETFIIVKPDEFDIGWLEDEINVRRHAFLILTDDSEKVRFARAFLELLDRALSQKDHYKKNGLEVDSWSVHMIVFNEANRWLHQDMCADMVWNWILKQAKTADHDLRNAMTIAVFEMIPDEPINPRNLTRLFDLLLDAETQWIVVSAYVSCEEKFYVHFMGHVTKGSYLLS